MEANLLSRLEENADMSKLAVPQVDNRPDLPELEEVEASNTNIFWVIGFQIAFVLLQTVAIAFSYVVYHDYFGKDQALVVAVGGTMVLLSLWVLLGLSLTDFKWKTNEQGILARGLLRKRFIRWTEVERISVRRTLSCSTYYILRTKKTTVTLPTNTSQAMGQGERLSASVWQHLRRLDAFDNLQLIDKAESFWDTVPDELVKEMDWENQKPPNWRAHVLFIMLFGALPVYLITNAITESKLSGLIVSIVLAPGYLLVSRLILREALLSVQKFNLREDYFEAKLPRRSVYIRWSDVTRADWERNNLMIRVCNPRMELCVPLISKDENSSKLILAIIRRLRTIDKPQAIIIPELLRSNYQEWQPEQCDTPVTENEAVLKMAWSEKLIISLLVYMFAMFCVVGRLSENGSPALITLVLAAVSSLLVTFTVCNSYVIKADNKGLSKRFLWWKRSIDWQEVTTENRLIQQNRTRSLLWQIKGEDSKASVTISNDIGAKRDRRKLLRFIQARLSEVLPPEELGKPWKSRPWKPE